MTEARIRELGNIGMVIYGNHAVRAAVTAMRQVFAQIQMAESVTLTNA